jgi:hypothetical protein
MAKRQNTRLKKLGEEMKVRRHEPVKVQGARLGGMRGLSRHTVFLAAA